VPIGGAVLVNGARPDVAALFPTAPQKDRAGWGYLLLTNFLPNQGNGTFTLYAYAVDLDGQQALLGTKTITCTNATATAPFGAIDTPSRASRAARRIRNFDGPRVSRPVETTRRRIDHRSVIDSTGRDRRHA
jgi:hypothetical protein